MRHAGGFALRKEIEIGEHTPFFQRTNALDECVGDVLGEGQKILTRSGVVCKDDLEIHGWFARPIVTERRGHADHLWRKTMGDLSDLVEKLPLLDKRSGDIHISIISRR